MEHWEKRLIRAEWFHVGWQLAKQECNVRKHRGVTFAAAMTVLDDEKATSEPQREGDEEREKLVGKDNTGRLLAVAVYIQAPDLDEGGEDIGFIRIISARLATSTEEKLYDGQARDFGP